jgi:hypothetical protein
LIFGPRDTKRILCTHVRAPTTGSCSASPNATTAQARRLAAAPTAAQCAGPPLQLGFSLALPALLRRLPPPRHARPIVTAYAHARPAPTTPGHALHTIRLPSPDPILTANGCSQPERPAHLFDRWAGGAQGPQFQALVQACVAVPARPGRSLGNRYTRCATGQGGSR